MPMYMVIWFSCECKFVFKELSTVNQDGESNCGLFMLGCFVTMIYCILHMFLASLKPKIMKNTLRSKIPLLGAKNTNKNILELQQLKYISIENDSLQQDDCLEFQECDALQIENSTKINHELSQIFVKKDINNNFVNFDNNNNKIQDLNLQIKNIQNKLQNKQSNDQNNQEIKGYQLSIPDRLRVSVWYLIFSLSNIMLMLLMMTMNGWVELFIALGLGIGYFIFQSAEGQEIEANSCHID